MPSCREFLSAIVEAPHSLDAAGRHLGSHHAYHQYLAAVSCGVQGQDQFVRIEFLGEVATFRDLFDAKARRERKRDMAFP